MSEYPRQSDPVSLIERLPGPLQAALRRARSRAEDEEILRRAAIVADRAVEIRPENAQVASDVRELAASLRQVPDEELNDPAAAERAAMQGIPPVAAPPTPQPPPTPPGEEQIQQATQAGRLANVPLSPPRLEALEPQWELGRRPVGEEPPLPGESYPRDLGNAIWGASLETASQVLRFIESAPGDVAAVARMAGIGSRAVPPEDIHRLGERFPVAAGLLANPQLPSNEPRHSEIAQGLEGFLNDHPELRAQPTSTWELLTSPRALSLATARLVPYMGSTLVLGLATGGNVVPFLYTWAVEGQNAYDSARQRGASHAQATVIKHTVGPVNALIEISQVGQLRDAMMNQLRQRSPMRALLRNIFEEGLQENAQGTSEEISNFLTTGRPVSRSVREFLDNRAQEFILMAATAGAGHAIGAAGRAGARTMTPEGRRTFRTILEAGRIVDGLFPNRTALQSAARGRNAAFAAIPGEGEQAAPDLARTAPAAEAGQVQAEQGQPPIQQPPAPPATPAAPMPEGEGAYQVQAQPLPEGIQAAGGEPMPTIRTPRQIQKATDLIRFSVEYLMPAKGRAAIRGEMQDIRAIIKNNAAVARAFDEGMRRGGDASREMVTKLIEKAQAVLPPEDFGRAGVYLKGIRNGAEYVKADAAIEHIGRKVDMRNARAELKAVIDSADIPHMYPDNAEKIETLLASLRTTQARPETVAHAESLLRHVEATGGRGVPQDRIDRARRIVEAQNAPPGALLDATGNRQVAARVQSIIDQNAHRKALSDARHGKVIEEKAQENREGMFVGREMPEVPNEAQPRRQPGTLRELGRQMLEKEQTLGESLGRTGAYLTEKGQRSRHFVEGVVNILERVTHPTAYWKRTVRPALDMQNKGIKVERGFLNDLGRAVREGNLTWKGIDGVMDRVLPEIPLPSGAVIPPGMTVGKLASLLATASRKEMLAQLLRHTHDGIQIGYDGATVKNFTIQDVDVLRELARRLCGRELAAILRGINGKSGEAVAALQVERDGFTTVRKRGRGDYYFPVERVGDREMMLEVDARGGRPPLLEETTPNSRGFIIKDIREVAAEHAANLARAWRWYAARDILESWNDAAFQAQGAALFGAQEWGRIQDTMRDGLRTFAGTAQRTGDTTGMGFVRMLVGAAVGYKASTLAFIPVSSFTWVNEHLTNADRAWAEMTRNALSGDSRRALRDMYEASGILWEKYQAGGHGLLTPNIDAPRGPTDVLSQKTGVGWSPSGMAEGSDKGGLNTAALLLYWDARTSGLSHAAAVARAVPLWERMNIETQAGSHPFAVPGAMMGVRRGWGNASILALKNETTKVLDTLMRRRDAFQRFPNPETRRSYRYAKMMVVGLAVVHALIARGMRKVRRKVLGVDDQLEGWRDYVIDAGQDIIEMVPLVGPIINTTFDLLARGREPSPDSLIAQFLQKGYRFASALRRDPSSPASLRALWQFITTFAPTGTPGQVVSDLIRRPTQRPARATRAPRVGTR